MRKTVRISKFQAGDIVRLKGDVNQIVLMTVNRINSPMRYNEEDEKEFICDCAYVHGSGYVYTVPLYEEALELATLASL